MLTGSSGTRLLDGRRCDRGMVWYGMVDVCDGYLAVGFHEPALSRSFCLLSSPAFLGACTHFGSTFLLMATFDARGYLVGTLLGIIFFIPMN